MTSADVVAMVLALGAGISGIVTAIAALLNVRNNKTELDKALARIDDLELQVETDRKDIILIGESLSQARADNAIVAEAFNQLWNEFYEATGHKPTANLDALRRLQTIQYITGRLQPK